MTLFNWVPVGDFMEGAFESRPLHIHNVLPTDYFSFSDLDAALTRSVNSALFV